MVWKVPPSLILPPSVPPGAPSLQTCGMFSDFTWFRSNVESATCVPPLIPARAEGLIPDIKGWNGSIRLMLSERTRWSTVLLKWSLMTTFIPNGSLSGAFGFWISS